MASTTVRGAPDTLEHYARFSASVVSGVVASLVGGLAMAVVMIVAFMTFQHTSLLYVLRPVGTFLYGDEMLVAPTAAMYLGAAAFHFGVAALWGIVFGFAAAILGVGESRGGALALGLVVGLTAQIVDINLVTPALLSQLWGSNLWAATVPPLYSWVGHLAFGASFVTAPRMFGPLWRRWSGRPDLPTTDHPRVHRLQ